MFPKLFKMACVQLRRVLLSIRVHKYGKGKNMGENAIYGQLDAFYIKCALYTLLLGLRISQAFIEK